MSDGGRTEGITVSRRTALSALGGSVAVTSAGFLSGLKVGERKRKTREGQTSAESDALSEDATVVDGWYVGSIPYIRVVDTLAVATSGDTEDRALKDRHFESIEPDGEKKFVLLYGEGYGVEDGEGDQSPPASKWVLDVWVPSQHLKPRVVEHPETKWYRLPEGVEENRYLPAYPENLLGGGYLCFEAESPGTVELLFSPDFDEFELEVPKAGARWKYTVTEDGDD